MMADQVSAMERWKIRVVIYKRGDRFEAECLEAAAAGVGATALEAMGDLVSMLNTMAILARKSGAALTSDADEEDETLYQALAAGHVPENVAAFGEISLALREGEPVQETHLERMELVGGPA
jgi:hypothetical protein